MQNLMDGKKGAIFDLDGVIVDTAKYHYLAWRKLANELGFDFTKEQNERLKGVSRVRSLEILLEIGGIEMDAETQAKMCDKKNDWYVESIKSIDSSELLKGAKEFLEELHKKGIKVALGSASKNAVPILEGLGIKDLFDVIIDGNKVSKAKPDPEVFLLGAKELGFDPKDCVVFEDAFAGVEAAKAGGFTAVGIGTKDNLPNADYNIDGLYEML
jgi:beta-phosphoglucomutase